MGLTYTFSYGSTLGQKCFKIWAPNSVSSDYGRLFKATIDDIIKYFQTMGNKEWIAFANEKNVITQRA